MRNGAVGGKRLINSSWIIGVVSIVLSFCGPFILYRLIDYSSGSLTGLTIILRPIYFLVLSVFAIIGFIKGISELKSSKKILAILGIVLCFFGLAASLTILFFPLLLSFYVAD